MKRDDPAVILASAGGVPELIQDRERVARIFLNAEMGRLLRCDDAASAITGLVGKDLWRLLEAMSFTYRANGMFRLISDDSLDWYEAVLPVSAITVIPGICPEVDKVLRLPDIDRSPTRLAGYLNAYYAAHPDDDPEGLDTFRPSGGEITHTVLMVRWHDGALEINDGTHRLMEIIQRDGESVNVLCALRNGKKAAPMGGDAVFIRMRQLYASARKRRERNAVLRVTRMLAARFRDGSDAIRTYWIDHESDERIQQAGRALLGNRPSS